MSVGIEVISKPLCKWNVYDIADFLYENGKNMNSDNWQRIADDMAMVAGDVRRLLDEALEEKVGDIEDLNAERDRLEGKIDDRDDKIAGLESDLASETDTIADLEEDLIVKNREIESLDGKIQDLEDVLSEKRSEIESLRNEVSELESRIDDLEDLVNGME